MRITPLQRRHLQIAVVIAFGVTVVAGLLAVGTGSGTATEVAVIGGLCWLVALSSYLTHAPARTVFGPIGIKGRNLAGRYAYRWDRIGNVALRVSTSRWGTGYMVILTTTDGNRIRLGAPVSGGLMGDPAFPAKYAQIRGTWQAATGRTGPDFEFQSIWTRGFILLTAGAFVQLIAAAVIAAIVSVYGPALAAHEGWGTRGVFEPQIQLCTPSCAWSGAFTAAGHARYVTLAPGGPPISQQFVTVPAVDTGSADTVYPASGGTAWRAPAAGLASASAVVIVVLAAQLTVLVRVLLRGRARARPARPEDLAW